MPKIDDIDRKILNLAFEKKITNNAKLAKHLNMKQTSLQSRVNALKEKKIIKGTEYRLNPENMDLPVFGIIIIDVENELVLEEIKKDLLSLSNVVLGFRLIGAEDYIIGLYVKSANEIEFIRKKLQNTNGVISAHPYIISEVDRFSTTPYPLKEEL